MLFRDTPFVAAPRSRRDLEAIAEGFLQKLYPEALRRPMALDIPRMMERLEDAYDVMFGVEDLPVGEEGHTDPATREIIIDTKVYRAMLAGDGRARHTCAHEVGHIPHICQVNQVIRDGGPQLARRLNVRAPVYCDPEWQAHGVAGGLLMPRTTMPSVYQRGGLEAVMETFRVSYTAAGTRIGILTKQGLIR